MRRNILFFLASFIALAVAYAAVLINVKGIPEAEYWEREAIVVKRAIALEKPSPKIILLGGSGVLFGFDAHAIETATHRPTVNFGLLGGMRIQRILALGAGASRAGDLIILSLERHLTRCDATAWTAWQIRNTLAWDRPYFDSLPLGERVRAVFSGGDPWLPLEMLSSATRSRINPGHYAMRLKAMQPEAEILQRFHDGNEATPTFQYSAYNLDRWGSMTHADASDANDLANDGTEVDTICPDVLAILRRYVSEMRARHVRVVFAYSPYMFDGAPNPHWQDSDAKFAHTIQSIDSTLIEQRDMAFLPRRDFFNMNSHLNTAGRAVRTARLVQAIQRLDLPPTRPAGE